MRFLRWDLNLKRRPKPVSIPEVIKGQVIEELKPFLTALAERLEKVEQMANATRVKVYRGATIASKHSEPDEPPSTPDPRAILATLNAGDSVPPNLLTLLGG